MRRTDETEPRTVRGDDETSGDEVLQLGRRRGNPRSIRFVSAAAVLLAAATAIGWAVSHHHHRASSTPLAASRSASHGVPHVPLRVPPIRPAPIRPDGAVLDVASVDRHLWLLHQRRITGTSRDRIGTSVPLPQFRDSEANGAPRLVRDATMPLLWAVLEGGTRHGQAVEYHLWTLSRMRDLQLPPVNGATAMGGHLYVTSGRQFLDVAPNGMVHAVHIRGVTGSLGPVMADPARSRVLVLDYSAHTHIWVYRPGQRHARKAATLPITKASIAVTGQAIWVGGFGSNIGSKSLLWRLDPTSLAPVGVSPLSGELGPGAVLLAAGTDDVWVGSGGGPGLWCVDSRTGTEEQHWSLEPTAVAVDHARVVVVSDGAAVPLRLGPNCTG